MSVPLIEVTRGGIVESWHRGFVAVTDGKGNLIASAGNPDVVTFMRSAAKPIQALNVIFSGAVKQYGITEKELAIMCSSHYGEEMHCTTVQGILEKLGLSAGDLLCGCSMSISASYRDRQLREHLPLNETNSDCSGKHSGFLSVCKTKGYPIENYVDAQHPMQQEVLQILAYMSNVSPSDIHIGVDGCGVPVHSLPLRSMAQAYARLTTPAQLEEPYQSACKTIVDAMNAYPEMIAGTNGFCTEFLKHTHGRFCAKLGAEAVYCIGVRDRDMGIAVKIEDGNYRALYPAVMSVLMQLELLTPQEIEALRSFVAPPNLNDHGQTVGAISPCFCLEMAR